MSRPRNPLCSRGGVRPRAQKQAYCRECRAILALEWYHKKHPEAKRHDQAKAEISEAVSPSRDSRTKTVDVTQNATVRRLLPVETERLMGFPGGWTRIPWRGKPAEDCPDSPRYKACGNSMCVNVMRWVGMRIENVERKMR